MTTWVDGRGLQSGFKEHAGRGIGTYVASLAQALDERAAEDEVRFFVEKGAELIAPVPLQRRVLAPSVPGGASRFATLLRQHSTLSLWLAKRRPAAVHFAAQTDAPALCAVPTIVTVHDVVLHRHGEWYESSGEGSSGWRFRVLRALERHAILRASRIIVPSRVTADELAASLQVPPHRIVVVPEAPADRFRAPPSAADADVRRRLGLPPRYLLHPGGGDARKRLPDLVRVFADVARERPELCLVLLGRVSLGDGASELARAVEASGVRDRIRVPGIVDARDVPAVYRGAEAVVLATRHEGFGLPVVEAFAAGAPVVATAASAIAEVAGDAARLVPVDQPAALGEAIRTVLDDAALREELRARGRRRSEQFRWELAAEETLAVYAQVARA
ncbi:MAG: glycosyltransferase family 4 protein [Deltaproteobacteria bacterium]|nr:glycosyltransferase family 4 protein [Deltaproteobacteria bacterium]